MREQRGLGLPWSPALVERARRTTAGTVAAARRALARGVGMNLGGGTHHAGYDFARGYCLFNDVAVALARVRADGARAARALVVDCDVHQGDGTAQVLAADPEAFTVSLHGARNYPFQRIPSDLDVDLPTGTGDRDYLRALDDALDAALPRARPDIAFYLAGADPFEGDRLGPPGPDQGRPAGPRRAGRRAPARRGRGRRRRPRRRLRARRRATRSTSTRRRRPWWPRPTRPMAQPLGLRVVGAPMCG